MEVWNKPRCNGRGVGDKTYGGYLLVFLSYGFSRVSVDPTPSGKKFQFRKKIKERERGEKILA